MRKEVVEVGEQQTDQQRASEKRELQNNIEVEFFLKERNMAEKRNHITEM